MLYFTINSLHMESLFLRDVKIGWYNVDTRVTYTVTYEGGDINSKRVNSSGVPDGDYKVCIVNGGSKSITGAMQYEVK